MTARSATWWLTIPEVCAYLQISEAEWHQWRAAGRTPLHAAGPNGQLKLRAVDLERWLEALAVDPADKLTPEDIAADWEATRGEDDDATVGPGTSAAGVVQLRPRPIAPAGIGPQTSAATHRAGMMSHDPPQPYAGRRTHSRPRRRMRREPAQRARPHRRAPR